MRTNNRFRLCTGHKHVKYLLVCTVPIDSQILYFRFSFVLVSRIMLNRHCSRMHYDTCSVLIGSVKISVPLLLEVRSSTHNCSPSFCLSTVSTPFHCVCAARALSCRVHQFNFLPQNYLIICSSFSPPPRRKISSLLLTIYLFFH